MPTIIQPTVNPIATNSVFLMISVGRLRTRKKLNISAVDVNDISPDLLRLSKETLQSSELKAIGEHDSSVHAFIKARALPSPFKGKGIIILPVRLIDSVMRHIEEAKVQRAALIEAFMLAYDRCKAESMGKLGSAFDERDYPDPDAVRRTFFFNCQVFEMSTPASKLSAIDRDLYVRESQKMQNVWDSARDTITSVLLEEFRKLTAHMADRLAPGDDGKGKTFRNTTITKLTEWLDLFSMRNLGDDTELVSVVNRARALVQGIDPENVRDSDDLRNSLAKDFTAITAELDTAIINRPARAIDIEELV